MIHEWARQARELMQGAVTIVVVDIGDKLKKFWPKYVPCIRCALRAGSSFLC